MIPAEGVQDTKVLEPWNKKSLLAFHLAFDVVCVLNCFILNP